MAGSEPPNRRGRLQTLPSSGVPPPAPTFVPPPARQVSHPGGPAPTPAPVPPQTTSPAAAPPGGGFYGRMLSGDVGKPVAPPPKTTSPAAAPPDGGFYGRMFSGDVDKPAPPSGPPRWRVAAAVFAAVAGLAVVVVGVGVAAQQFAAPAEVVKRPVPLTLDEARAMADLWLAFGAPGSIRDDGVARRVASIGEAVAGPMTQRLGGRTPRFRVIQHAAPRTVALPDATVTISTGLLERLKNDAELAAVLAHSLAHVAAGHVLVMATSDEQVEAIRAALKGGSPVLAIDALAAAVSAPGTPEREQAADALMVEGLRAANRSSLAAVTGLGRLQAEATAPGNWAAVHPIDPLRQQRLEAVPPFGVVDESSFQKEVLVHLRPAR